MTAPCRWLVLASMWAGSVGAAEDLSHLADPMMPAPQRAVHAAPKPAAPPVAELLLQSIIVHPDRRYAVIQGRQVSEGDSVDGMTVLQIRNYEVLVGKGRWTRVLRLVPSEVSRDDKS